MTTTSTAPSTGRIATAFLNELDNEAKVTRTVLERIPADKFDYKPHEKSMTFGRLASHIAEMFGWTEMTLKQDMTIWSVLPHTHMRGKKWQVSAIYPDGRSEIILDVPKYDFNWQTDYIFKQPLSVPKGTKIHTAAWYDNSTANKANPDPKKDVYWGDQTWEEMQFTAITFSLNASPTQTAGAAKQ